MRQTICFIAAAMVLLASACGGKSGKASQSVAASDSPTPQPTAAATVPPTVPPPSVSQADLPGMVITAKDLAAPYSDFVMDPSTSGPRARDMVIEDACDPQRQARELVSTNWVAEYYTEFESPTEDGQAADGTFDISSSADLFVNEAGGAAGFKAMVGDELRAANSQCQSANMGSVTPFDFPTIGDESWGATATATFSGVSGLVSAVFTSVVARSGQVVVTVSIVQIGGQGLPDETERLAQLMIQRISGSPNV